MFSKILNSKTENIIGLEISPDNLNICCAEKKSNNVVFRDYFFTKFEEEKLANFLDHFVQKNNLKNSKINISISSNDAYVKKITLPDLPEREMALIVLQEIEKNLPISPDELYIDYAVVRRYTDRVEGVKKADIIYAAVQKYLVQNYIKLAETAGLKINSIEIPLFSALKCNFLPECENNTIAVFIDYENTDIAFLKDGQPLGITSLAVGRKELECNVPVNQTETDSPITYDSDEFFHKERLIKNYDKICLEISALIDLFYTQNNNETGIEKIILISNSLNLEDIKNYISQKTSIDCVFLSPDLNFENREIEKHLLSAACCGLVLENENKISLNVLKNLSQNAAKYSKEIFSEEEKKKLKMLMAVTGILICICTVVWGYFFIMNSRAISECKRLEKRYEFVKPALDKITAQSEGLKEQKEILKVKLLAKNVVDKNVLSWSRILVDISSIVPKDIKIREITKETARSGDSNFINIKGQISSTKQTPLQLISFLALNINSNLPHSTQLTNASVKDVKFKEDDSTYEFNITSDIKPK